MTAQLEALLSAHPFGSKNKVSGNFGITKEPPVMSLNLASNKYLLCIPEILLSRRVLDSLSQAPKQWR